jgi:hypothetical protein
VLVKSLFAVLVDVITLQSMLVRGCGGDEVTGLYFRRRLLAFLSLYLCAFTQLHVVTSQNRVVVDDGIFFSLLKGFEEKSPLTRCLCNSMRDENFGPRKKRSEKNTTEDDNKFQIRLW